MARMDIYTKTIPPFFELERPRQPPLILANHGSPDAHDIVFGQAYRPPSSWNINIFTIGQTHRACHYDD